MLANWIGAMLAAMMIFSLGALAATTTDSAPSHGAPGGHDASRDKYEILGPAYGDIGVELAEIVGGDPNGVLLYAESGQGWLGFSVFKDEGRVVRYYPPTTELGDLIETAWLAEDPDKRWAVIEYAVTGTRFDASFKFPDEVDVKWYDIDRREEAVKRHFGDKPVIYPSAPNETLTVRRIVADAGHAPTYASARLPDSRSRSYDHLTGNAGSQDSRRTVHSS
jgi:hypothetical protein